MHRSVGLTIVLLAASCATPRVDTQPDGPVRARAEPPRAIDFLPIRVGIEYLPEVPDAQPGHATRRVPGPGLCAARVRPTPGSASEPDVAVESSAAEARERRVYRAPEGQTIAPWTDDPAEVGRIEDPYEQLAVKFVNDLLGEDRRRIQRHVGAPVLITRLRHTMSPVLFNHLDEREGEEEAAYINELGLGLVRGPCRRILRNLTVFQEIDSLIEDFRGENMPMTGPYLEQRPRRMKWGRVSARLKMRNSDPLTLTYINFGWRVGSSLRRLKCSYGIDLAEDVHASVRLNYRYDTANTDVHADLHWRIDEDTNMHMAIGEDLNFLAGPTAYALVDSPMDGAPGLLFYVEHLF